MPKTYTFLTTVFFISIFLFACSEDQQTSSLQTRAHSKVVADIVLKNAYVYTVDKNQSVQQAVAIKENKIIYVGDDQGADQFVGKETELRDLNGRMLMPGLHDTHIHGAGIVDLDICDMQDQPFTLEEMVPFIQSCLEEYQVPDGEWLIVSQWAFSYGNQPSKDVPTLRVALDNASISHPIMLAGNDGHHAAVNSLALAKAKNKQGEVIGLNKNSLKTDFALYKELIAVDETGEPNGAISEVARFLVKEDYMKEYQYLFEPAEVLMPLVANNLAANGITSIQEAYVDKYLLDYYLWLADKGEMNFRTRMALAVNIKDPLSDTAHEQIPDLVNQIKIMREKAKGIPNLQANAVKLLVDSVLEGNPYAVPPTLPVAAILGEFKQPVFSIDNENEKIDVTVYVDLDSALCQSIRSTPDKYVGAILISRFIEEHGFHPTQCTKSSGVLGYHEGFIKEFIHQTTKAGFHVHIHAVSDKAVRLTMDAFEEVKETADNLGLTQSITHAQLVHPDDVKRIGDLGVYVAFAFAWAGPIPEYDLTVIPFIEEVNNSDNLYNPNHYYFQNVYPVKSIKDAGGIITWGSDAPVDSRNPRPFINLQTAVSRTVNDFILNENEEISIHEAIAAFTINGARLLGHNKKLGSIEVGKTADLIVLNQNVVKLAEQGEADKIGETLVDITIFDGKFIYERQLVKDVYPVNYDFSEFLTLQPAEQPGTFRKAHEISPTRIIRKGTSVNNISEKDIAFNVSYKLEDDEYSIDDFMQRNNTTGLLVLKNGENVYEEYKLGADAKSLFTTFSIGKSITGTLIGLAIADGLIKSVDDLLVDYMPQYKETAYAQVTIKQALQMSSGVEFIEEYGMEEESHMKRLWQMGTIERTESFSEIMQSLQNKHPPGSVFNYSTGESTLLSELLHTVTGKTVADYLSEKLWSKIGMDSDAYWPIDKEGMEMGGGGMSLSLGDLARFGLLMLNDGLHNNQRILPEGWVSEATTPDSSQVQPGKLYEDYPLGYQYHWWTFPGDNQHAYEAQGIFGQFLYINPAENIVIAMTSVWPVAWDDDKEIETYALFHAIEEFLR